MGAEIWRDIRQAASTRASRSGDHWYLNEVYLSINGKHQYLWRAVDQDGEVVDILVQPRRNKKAAKKLFRKFLKGLQYIHRAIITDKLGSYAAAKAELLPDVEHIQDKRSNNKTENSHQPTRERERQMRGFKSAGHGQKFLAGFGIITSFFSPDGRPIVSGSDDQTLRIWPASNAWPDELCMKLTHKMSHKQWCEWVTPDIGYDVQSSGP